MPSLNVYNDTTRCEILSFPPQSLRAHFTTFTLGMLAAGDTPSLKRFWLLLFSFNAFISIKYLYYRICELLVFVKEFCFRCHYTLSLCDAFISLVSGYAFLQPLQPAQPFLLVTSIVAILLGLTNRQIA